MNEWWFERFSGWEHRRIAPRIMNIDEAVRCTGYRAYTTKTQHKKYVQVARNDRLVLKQRGSSTSTRCRSNILCTYITSFPRVIITSANYIYVQAWPIAKSYILTVHIALILMFWWHNVIQTSQFCLFLSIYQDFVLINKFNYPIWAIIEITNG